MDQSFQCVNVEHEPKVQHGAFNLAVHSVASKMLRAQYRYTRCTLHLLHAQIQTCPICVLSLSQKSFLYIHKMMLKTAIKVKLTKIVNRNRQKRIITILPY